MADSSPPRVTPKRKRGDEELSISPTSAYTHFSFQLPQATAEDDGSASPRSKVAHKFRGLALEGGGGVTQQQSRSESFDSMLKEDDDDLMMRKRQKPDAIMHEADDAVQPVVGIVDLEGKTIPQPVADPIILKATHGRDSLGNSLRQSYPSINRLADSKSRARKRTGTPPLIGGKRKDGDRPAEEEEREVVEPVRASLTWHDDEITVYDPEDEDDDGTGINGIGFQPTPALAYARTQRRKQQLAEYRKREESDARAKRSQRRRGSPGMSIKLDSKASAAARRVRFMESEANTVTTTG